MNQEQLLADCLRRLNSANVSYMLTGSMASNFWGIPRTTHDLDFVIQLPPSAVSKMTEAFRTDFFLDERAVRAAYQPPHQFNALDERSSLKVDFWMLKNIPFEREMFSRRQRATIFGEPAWIASPEDVILHKLYWDGITPSERQRLDASGIVVVQRGRLDLAYLRRWATELNVADTFEALLDGRIGPKQT